MSASATQGGHNNSTVIYVILITLSYYLFNVKCTTFNKICSLVTCTGNQIPIVLAAVDRVINEITASNEMPSITALHCNIYLAFKILTRNVGQCPT